MSQQIIKALATKSEDLRLIPGNHMVEGESRPLYIALWSSHLYDSMQVLTYINTYKHTNKLMYFKGHGLRI